MSFVPRTFEFMLQRMINRVVARTAITDLADTSASKHILAACAREIDEVWFALIKLQDAFGLFRASGSDLDTRAADIDPALLARRTEIAAPGTVVFSRTVGAGSFGAISIPSGVRIEVPGESPPIVAVTTAAGSLGAFVGPGTQNSAPVAASILLAGSRGNVAIAALSKFAGAKPAGVDSVSNTVTFKGGADVETDDSFRARIFEYIRSLSGITTAFGLEVAARRVIIEATGQRVIHAKAVRVVPGLVNLYIDDGSGNAESTDSVTDEVLTASAAGGEVEFFAANKPVKAADTVDVKKNTVSLVRDGTGANGFTVEPASGQIILNTALTTGDNLTVSYTWFTSLIAATQRVVDGDPLDRANFPGVRAAGDEVIVLSPTVENVEIDVEITVADGVSQEETIATARNVIVAYINGLGIGSDVILAEIVEQVMGIAGMLDVQIVSPSSNVTILSNQLARTEAALVTVR